MNSRLNQLTFWLAVLAGLMFPATSLFAQPPGKGGGGGGGGSSGTSSWRTVAVSSQPGMVSSINSSGQMAGFLENFPGLVVPYTWTIGAGDSVTAAALDLSYVQQSATGELEWVANSGAANCVNDQGSIAGSLGYRDPTGALPDLTAAVIWTSPQATAVALPLPASTSNNVFDSSEAFAISHEPTAEAFSGLRAVAVGRYLWRSNGGDLVVLAAWAILADGSIQSPIILDIGLTGQYESAPLAINRGLTVAGTLDDSAMVWQLEWVEQPAEPSESEAGEAPLPPVFALTVTGRLELFPKGNSSRAAGINDAGDICGQHWRSGSDHGAFLLTRVGDTYQNQSLALLVNTNREKTRNIAARALDNSASPRVIGVVDTFTKTSYTRLHRPVQWQGSSVQDLKESNSTSGLFPSYLGTINDSGRIAGQGWNGSQHLPVVMVPN